MWPAFTASLTARFHEKALIDPLVEIKKLKQTGTLQEYLEEFDNLLSKVDLSEPQALSHFLGGLR